MLRVGLVLVCLVMIGAILFVCLTRAQEAPAFQPATAIPNHWNGQEWKDGPARGNRYCIEYSHREKI